MSQHDILCISKGMTLFHVLVIQVLLAVISQHVGTKFMYITAIPVLQIGVCVVDTKEHDALVETQLYSPQEL